MNKFVCRVCKNRESHPNVQGHCNKFDKAVKRTTQGCQYYENRKPKEIKVGE